MVAQHGCRIPSLVNCCIVAISTRGLLYTTSLLGGLLPFFVFTLPNLLLLYYDLVRRLLPSSLDYRIIVNYPYYCCCDRHPIMAVTVITVTRDVTQSVALQVDCRETLCWCGLAKSQLLRLLQPIAIFCFRCFVRSVLFYFVDGWLLCRMIWILFASSWLSHPSRLII